MIAEADTWTVPEELAKLRHFAATAAVRYGLGESAEDYAQEATLLWLQTPPSKNRLLNLKRKVISRLVAAWQKNVRAETSIDNVRVCELDRRQRNFERSAFYRLRIQEDEPHG